MTSVCECLRPSHVSVDSLVVMAADVTPEERELALPIPLTHRTGHVCEPAATA
jgi:hypothetical protein